MEVLANYGPQVLWINQDCVGFPEITIFNSNVSRNVYMSYVINLGFPISLSSVIAP